MWKQNIFFDRFIHQMVILSAILKKKLWERANVQQKKKSNDTLKGSE